MAITPAELGAVYLRSDHHRLVAAIGLRQARRMIFTALPLDAEETRTIGLVDQVVSGPNLEHELARIVGVISSGSPYALLHSKRMLRLVGSGETPDETDTSIG